MNRRASLFAFCGIGFAFQGCGDDGCRPSTEVHKLGFVIPPEYFKYGFCRPAEGDSLIFTAIAPSMVAPKRDEETWKDDNHVSILISPLRSAGRGQFVVDQAVGCATRPACKGPNLALSATPVRIYSDRLGRGPDATVYWNVIETLADGTLWLLEHNLTSKTFRCWRRFGPVKSATSSRGRFLCAFLK
jgi:hypothetical protein